MRMGVGQADPLPGVPAAVLVEALYDGRAAFHVRSERLFAHYQHFRAARDCKGEGESGLWGPSKWTLVGHLGGKWSQRGQTGGGRAHNFINII